MEKTPLEKLPPLPSDSINHGAPTFLVRAAQHVDGDPIVVMSIGRPLVEVTEAGEMVASIAMLENEVLDLIQDLKTQLLRAKESHN